jgi:hypothetical protein
MPTESKAGKDTYRSPQWINHIYQSKILFLNKISRKSGFSRECNTSQNGKKIWEIQESLCKSKSKRLNFLMLR